MKSRDSLTFGDTHLNGEANGGDTDHQDVRQSNDKIKATGRWG